jgi:excisionase family DNA binding protein
MPRTPESEKPLPPREWVTVKEAAYLVNCSPRSIYRLISQGRLRVCRLNDRQDIRIALRDLNAALEASRNA